MKQRFLTGLIILLPLVITLWILTFFVRLATQPFKAGTEALLKSFGLFQDGWWIFSEQQMLHGTTTLLILFGLFFGLFVLGFLSRWFFIHIAWGGIERLLLKIPFVSGVYKSCRDFIGVIFSPREESFSRVVWFPFPTPEQKALAVVTNEMLLATGEEMPQEFVSVYLPGTPNPTVGFLLLCPKKNILSTDIPVDSAMKWVISCGSSEVETVLEK
jgi:uncharacterized membrane protein